MDDTSRFEDWIRTYEKDQKLINGFVQSLKGLESLSELAEFLSHVTKDYKFRREEVASFFSKSIDLETGRPSLIREKNGFFLTRETIIQYFISLSRDEKTIRFPYKCSKCGNVENADLKFSSEEIKINYAKELYSKPLLLDPIFLETEIDNEQYSVWFHIDKNRKLRKSERELVLKNNFKLIEIILGNPKGTIRSWGFEHCRNCRNGQRVTSEVTSFHETIAEESEIIPEKSLHENNDPLEKRDQTIKELEELLNQKMPFGDYFGKPFRWLIGFKESYLEKLLKEMDPEEELRDFLKKIYLLAEKIEYDGFPDLLGLAKLLDRTKR